MIFECSAVIAVIVITAFMIYRSGRGRGYAVGILPLTLVPAVHMMGKRFSLPISNLLPMGRMVTYISMDILALVITCLILGGISAQIKTKRARYSYLVICGGFAFALTCVLLVRTVIQ